jgi:hypothetical protein
VKASATATRTCYVCRQAIKVETYWTDGILGDGAIGDRHMTCLRPATPEVPALSSTAEFVDYARRAIDAAREQQVADIDAMMDTLPEGDPERTTLRHARERTVAMTRSEFAAYKGIV